MSFLRLWKGFALVGVVSAPLLVGSFAKAAPREITEYEARKLTFAALTATPVFHHYRPHSAKSSYAMASRKTRTSTVRTVAYHGHVVTRHVRNRHQRHG
ncbi:hypothetical protein PT277_04425 [Acetobacteraceae bacterium ESL0709]|nr:hypothetical protein [Acetobacteraceae bacterium ESL0697]MDF7677943.1 hypothetical protein [Acetobacteraceae bacterium ESL0709]